MGEKQRLAHDDNFDVDKDTSVWSSSLDRKLKQHGVPSFSVTLEPGQAIILPPDHFHCFKKIPPADAAHAEFPLIGVACDSTYIGASASSLQRYHNLYKVSLPLYYNLEFKLINRQFN